MHFLAGERIKDAVRDLVSYLEIGIFEGIAAADIKGCFYGIGYDTLY